MSRVIKKDPNKDLFILIKNLRAELAELHAKDAPTDEKLDCFKRLVGVYALLNVETANEFEKKVKAA